ncbi:MAG TPA: hypothetical protein PKN95_08420 [Verrucomicrobiota bacterium]|nr:hypothetical protein [Verrucomicrobiota bacterium]HNT16050.1 hypothetical protein [Verrucomicrobiota bacterium]
MKSVPFDEVLTSPRRGMPPASGGWSGWLRRSALGAGCAAALMLTGGAAIAQTYLIDFGGVVGTSRGPVPNDPDHAWNNVNTTVGVIANSVLANLVDTYNSTSSVSLVIIDPFNDVNDNGTRFSTLYPENATRDSLYGNTESFNGKANIFPKFKLTGLDAATKYTFTFFASRMSVSDNRETEYTVTGATTETAVLNVAGNEEVAVTVSEMSPDTAGEISIALAPSVNNNNANHFTYLGVLQVDAVPPQAPLNFTRQPASQTVVQLNSATFECAVSGPAPYFVQWYENGNPIYNAHDFTYTVPVADLSMDGYTYSVTVSNLVYGVASTNAVLHVSNDNLPPVLVGAACYDGQTVIVTFNEALDWTTASDMSHYTVNSGAVTLTSVLLDAETGKTVTLYLGESLSGNFTVTVNGIKDVVGNTIAPNSSITGTAVAIEDQDLLFDFGAGGSPTQFGPAPDDPVNYWNNVTSAGITEGGEVLDLVTVHNAPTPIGLVMIARFNGVNENGTLNSTLFPAAATRDSLFGNTEAFGSGANFFPQFKLTGLNPSRQYSLSFYASRMGVGDNRETGYTVEGSNTGFAALNAANNVNNLTTVTGISPTAAGEITVSIAPTPNNNNANHFTYLGVMRLGPYVAPLAFTTVQVSGGKVHLSWTGTGQLERATSVNGEWTPVLPAPASPYEEDVVAGESRFFRLKQ